MSLVCSCTDGYIASRGAQYVGDPARDTSCPLWEAAAPWWGMIGRESKVARGAQSGASRQAEWGSEGARTCMYVPMRDRERGPRMRGVSRQLSSDGGAARGCWLLGLRRPRSFSLV